MLLRWVFDGVTSLPVAAGAAASYRAVPPDAIPPTPIPGIPETAPVPYRHRICADDTIERNRNIRFDVTGRDGQSSGRNGLGCAAADSKRIIASHVSNAAASDRNATRCFDHGHPVHGSGVCHAAAG